MCCRPSCCSPAWSTGFSSSTARNGASRPCRTCSTSSAPQACWRSRLLVVDYILVSPQLFGFFFFGKITIALYWLVQMFFLGGPRLAFRYIKYAQSRQTLQRDANTPTLLLGRGTDIEVVLRAIESGSVRTHAAQGRPVLSRRRSRPVDPRRSGARHLRGSRSGGAGFPRARRRRSAASWRRRARWRPKPIPTC